MATITFQATPYKIDNWTIVKLPKDASAKLPSRGQVMVNATLNGYKFQTALEPDGDWGHWFNLDESLWKSAKITSGETLNLAIEPTKDWPEPTVPADWQAALSADRQVQSRWQNVTPMARWEWLRWINSTANPETRKRRVEVSCSKLLAGERRPCCFNRNMCCVPEVSKNGVLLEPSNAAAYTNAQGQAA